MPPRPYNSRPAKMQRPRSASELLQIAMTMQDMIQNQGVSTEDLQKALEIVKSIQKDVK